MGFELAPLLAEWIASRYALDPLAEAAERRVRRVFEIAIAKGRGRRAIYDERTVLKVVHEATTSDDEVLADYLGGVIAGGNGTDDAVAFVMQIGRLSALQLRLHYLIYRQLWLTESSHPSGTDLRSHNAMRSNAELFLTLDDLHATLPIESDGDGVRSMLSALHVLAREDLIGAHGFSDNSFNGPNPVAYDILEAWALGQIRPRQFPAAGLICSPTPTGIELFLRGCGNAEHDPTYIRDLNPELVQVPIGNVQGMPLSEMPATRAS